MATDQTEARRAGSYEIAEAIAPTWTARRDDIESASAPVRRWMLEAAAPRPGESVLELAAGTGDTGFEAARLVGDGGRLVCTDFSPTMLEGARKRGEELGLRNVDYHVVDAQRMTLDDASFDAALCRFGYMLMDDPAAALAETRRVLRPGGRLALAVWGPPERNPFFAMVGGSLIRRGHVPPPDPSGPGVFSLSVAERTTALLEGAGFQVPRVEEVPVRFALPDVDEYVSMIADTAGPIAFVLRRLSDRERAQVRDDVAEPIEQFAAGAGYEVPGLALCALALA